LLKWEVDGTGTGSCQIAGLNLRVLPPENWKMMIIIIITTTTITLRKSFNSVPLSASKQQ
jgi:hypothetical protein